MLCPIGRRCGKGVVELATESSSAGLSLDHFGSTWDGGRQSPAQEVLDVSTVQWAQVTPKATVKTSLSGNLGEMLAPGEMRLPGEVLGGSGEGGARVGGRAWSAWAWEEGLPHTSSLLAGHQTDPNGGDVSGVSQGPFWTPVLRGQQDGPRLSFWVGSRLLCRLCPLRLLTPRSQARGK